jgi:hypothetical protein
VALAKGVRLGGSEALQPHGEREVLAKTAAKQIALRRKKRARFRRQLRRRRQSLPQRDTLLRRGA